MSISAFERYAPFIQEYIYRKKWTDLKEVQVEACEAIMDSSKHVIIASGTASGKTEAAFFPILSLLDKQPSKSIGVLYIGPLKALINDQFERLHELLENQDIPVWPWHGDISQSLKQKALKTSKGILQITPEALEAMLMRHPGVAGTLFSDLRFVVIDEIHIFMGADRGLQLQCLLSRIEDITGIKPRRIGLSATLNDYKPAMKFLSAGTGVETISVGIQNHKRTIALCAENFFIPEENEKALEAIEKYYYFVYDNIHTKKCLIFTNSRGEAEKIIKEMKIIADERKERDIFFVHHGSISSSLRNESERALKKDEPVVTAATLTLELGIDIGDLDSIIQLGAPFSCSSFVQRLGRSGRRTGKSQMMFVSTNCEKCDIPLDIIPWDLIQSIAIIQLYLEERWIEPFEIKKKPFSLLAHQTLSALMMNGEMKPNELARKVLLLPPFKNTISTDEYKELLQYMLEKEFIQRIEGGGIIVGLNGEKITNHYTFYSVFRDDEGFHVIDQGREIGTLQYCPSVGASFVLAGNSWKVTAIDEERKKVFVTKTSRSNVPNWSGVGGYIHTRIVQRMKQVLQETAIYSYLQPEATERLIKAREDAIRLGILERSIVPNGKDSYFIVPWVGTKEMYTIERLLNKGLKEKLKVKSAEVRRLYCIKVVGEMSAEEFAEELRNVCVEECNIINMVLNEDELPKADKYDSLVPKNLLQIAYLNNQLDIVNAVKDMQQLRI